MLKAPAHKSFFLLLWANALCLQAIIRGLKESGVFTSAVTSAKAQSETKSSNMGLGGKESIIPNTTAGHEKLQATARKILEMVDAQEEAMPPMSPPGFVELTESALSWGHVRFWSCSGRMMLAGCWWMKF